MSSKLRPPLLLAAAAVYVGIGGVLKKGPGMGKDVTQGKGQTAPRAELPAAAIRALAEAEERRRQKDLADSKAGPKPKELNGPKGPEPTRYGDWEKKGIASDF
jgi:hypothetical protein